MARRQPYTAIGIKRKRCVRCGEKAHAQWNVCALGKQHFPVCKQCDIGLNRLAVKYMRVPDGGAKLQDYEARLTA